MRADWTQNSVTLICLIIFMLVKQPTWKKLLKNLYIFVILLSYLQNFTCLMILSALKKSIFMILISKDSSKMVFYWAEFPLYWIILNKFCWMWLRDALLNVVQSRDQTWLFPLRTQMLIFSVLRIFARFCSLFLKCSAFPLLSYYSSLLTCNFLRETFSKDPS